MKPKKLKKITNDNYFVNEDKNTCVTKTQTMICNFYIFNLYFHTINNVDIAAVITLKSSKKKETATIPIEYFYEPEAWLRLYFNKKNFHLKINKILYNEHMVQILNYLSKKSKRKELVVGWRWKKVKGSKKYNFFKLKYKHWTFDSHDDPEYDIGYITENHHNTNGYKMNDLVNLIDNKVSIPLVSFMLLSSITSLLESINRKPNFIMSLTGSSSSERFKAAITYCNLFHRNREPSRSCYEHLHVFGDIASNIRLKSLLATDRILIASDLDKSKFRTLRKIYDPDTAFINEESLFPVHGLCLILAESYKTIPFKTVNVDISKIDLSKLNTYYKDKEKYDNPPDIYGYDKNNIDDISVEIGFFLKYLGENMSTDNRFILNSFNTCRQFIENDTQFMQMKDFAQEIYMYLTFSFTLFLSGAFGMAPSEIFKSGEYKSTNDILINVAKNAFPAKNDILYSDIEYAKEVCKALDNYFEKKMNHKYIQKTGTANIQHLADTKVWYDDEIFLMKSDDLQLILSAHEPKLKFTTKAKKALAQENLILTHKGKEDNQVEYSIHYQKELYKGFTTKKRFVAFHRSTCKAYNLFPNIDSVTQ